MLEPPAREVVMAAYEHFKRYLESTEMPDKQSAVLKQEALELFENEDLAVLVFGAGFSSGMQLGADVVMAEMISGVQKRTPRRNIPRA